MRQHGFVGRALIRDDSCQQRAMEPSSVLIGPFEIQIGRPPAARFEHRVEAHPRFKPDIEDIVFLFEDSFHRRPDRRYPGGSRSDAG